MSARPTAPLGTAAGRSQGTGWSGTLRRVGSDRRIQWAIATLIYLLLALVAWGGVLHKGLSVALPSGSVDPPQEVWFLAWALHALETSQNPFFTHAMFAPEGVNILANPSVLTLGVVLSPITLFAGPLAAFNTAVIAAPVLSALSAAYAVSRYVRWLPAALVAGLVYGYGPFLTTDLRFGHLNLTFLALPPLILAAVDELFVRQKRSSPATGVALGLLVVVQFFLSTEMDLLTALVSAAGLAILAASNPHQVGERLRRARTGIATALVVSGGALAYPLWYAVAGPWHTRGPVWQTLPQLSATVESFAVPQSETPGVRFVSGGNGAYLGVTLLVIIVASLFAWRRDRRVRFATGMTLLAGVLGLGYSLRLGSSSTGVPLPADLFRNVPVLESVAPYHFGAFVDFFAGATLALALENLRAASPGRRAAALRVGAVASAALLPFALVLHWPYPTRSVAQPPIFKSHLLSATPQPVVVEFPPAGSTLADDLLWQSTSGMHFDLTDGYAIRPGPSGVTDPFPPADALALEFAAAQLGRLHGPPPRATVAALRQALAADQATIVLVDEGATGGAMITGVMKATLGPPAQTADGWSLWRVQMSGHG